MKNQIVFQYLSSQISQENGFVFKTFLCNVSNRNRPRLSTVLIVEESSQL